MLELFVLELALRTVEKAEERFGAYLWVAVSTESFTQGTKFHDLDEYGTGIRLLGFKSIQLYSLRCLK